MLTATDDVVEKTGVIFTPEKGEEMTTTAVYCLITVLIELTAFIFMLVFSIRTHFLPAIVMTVADGIFLIIGCTLLALALTGYQTNDLAVLSSIR